MGKAQAKVLAPLFPVDEAHAKKPPAYVRPSEMPEPATRAYYFADLIEELSA